MKTLINIFFLILWLGVHATTMAETVPENVLKSVMIERITRFIDWPQSLQTKDNDTFVIGIAGKVDFDKTMQDLFSNRSIKQKNVSFVNLDINSNKSINCHIVIVGEMGKDQLHKFLNKIKNKPVLVISDIHPTLDQYIMVYLYRQNNHLRFDLDADTIKKSGLGVDYRLLQYARDIQLLD